MKIELLFIELLLGSMILGGLIAHKRSVGERLMLFISVPISFLLSFTLTKIGIFDGIGKLATDILLRFSIIETHIGGSMAATSTISAIVAVAVRPLFMLIIFWILLLIFKITVSLICRKKNTGIFTKPEKAKEKRNIISIALGVVGAFVIVMFSCLPFDFISNLAEPAIEKATAESYQGTYVYEVAKAVDEKYLPTSKTEVFGKIQYYTGMKSILNGVANSLSETSLTTNNGEELEFNVSKLIQDLLKDEVDIIALYDHMNSPGTRSGAEIAHVSNVIDTFVDSPVVLAVLPEILDAVKVENELVNKLLGIMSKKYSSDDITVLSKDFVRISDAVKAIAEGAKNEKLRKGNMTRIVLNSLSKQDVANRVADDMSEMSIYADVLGAFTEFGVEYLCDTVKVKNKDEMLASIIKKESYDQEDKQAFAKMISTAALFASKFDGETDSTVGIVLSNFSLVGRLLDAFQAFELTSELPSKLLISITSNVDYGKYFVDSTVVKMTENVKNGLSTYEELFSSVQAIYKIVNQVIDNR